MTTLAKLGTAGPTSIVVDSAHVYWANGNGTIMSLPLAGGTPAILASAQYPSYLALDATHLYWTSGNDTTVNGMRLDGTAPTVLTFGQSVPSAIAVDGTSV